jgi:hypothetical protein
MQLVLCAGRFVKKAVSAKHQLHEWLFVAEVVAPIGHR